MSKYLNYINCDSDIKPTEIGFYTIKIDHVRSSLPEYLEFDGNSWKGLEEMKKENEGEEIFWIEGDKALQEKPVFHSPFSSK